MDDREKLARWRSAALLTGAALFVVPVPRPAIRNLAPKESDDGR